MEKKFQRGSFVFYRSFRESIEELPESAQLSLYRAISLYALDGTAPDFAGLDDKNFIEAIWISIKPILDSSRRRYFNGMKYGKLGGAPKGSHNNPNGRRGKMEEPPQPEPAPEPTPPPPAEPQPEEEKPKKPKEEKFNFLQELLNAGADEQEARDWMETRRLKDASNTRTAFIRTVNNMKKCGLTVKDGVHIAAGKMWRGFEVEYYKGMSENNNNKQYYGNNRRDNGGFDRNGIADPNKDYGKSTI